MLSSLHFRGNAAKLLERGAEQRTRRRGDARRRRAGDYTALLGGLMALTGERALAGRIYVIADRANVAENNVEFDACCQRMGVPYVGYAEPGGTSLIGNPPADPVALEVRMRSLMDNGGPDVPTGGWRTPRPGPRGLQLTALRAARAAGCLSDGSARLPSPELERDNVDACQAAIEDAIAAGDYGYDFHWLTLVGAYAAARTVQLERTTWFLNHWLDCAERHTTYVCPAEVIIPEGLSRAVLSGALRDRIPLDNDRLHAITADIVEAVRDRIAGGDA